MNPVVAKILGEDDKVRHLALVGLAQRVPVRLFTGFAVLKGDGTAFLQSATADEIQVLADGGWEVTSRNNDMIGLIMDCFSKAGVKFEQETPRPGHSSSVTRIRFDGGPAKLWLKANRPGVYYSVIEPE
jgi:hypothetical protein